MVTVSGYDVCIGLKDLTHFMATYRCNHQSDSYVNTVKCALTGILGFSVNGNFSKLRLR